MENEDRPLLLSCPVINKTVLSELGAVLVPEDRAFLQSVGIKKTFVKHSNFASYGECIESLIFLHKGLTRCVGTGNDGNEKTYIYVSEGCFIAEAGFFHRQPILFQMNFMKDSEVLLIGRQYLPEILARPNLMLFIMTTTSLVSRILAMQIEDAAFRTTEEKVCRTIFCLSGEEYIQYIPHFTHQDIADLAGVHRVTVTNILAVLKKKGIICMSPRGNIRVMDRERLRSKGWNKC